MRTIALLTSAAIFASCALVLAPAPASAVAYYTGTVTHVSSGNIKVKDKYGKELSFLLAPSFDQIFSDDGKTTYQMKNVTPGRHVKIVYHQQLGVRYADKIIILS